MLYEGEDFENLGSTRTSCTLFKINRFFLVIGDFFVKFTVLDVQNPTIIPRMTTPKG